MIDAALVLLASEGDVIVTSDLDDIEPLARAFGRHVELVRVVGDSRPSATFATRKERQQAEYRS